MLIPRFHQFKRKNRPTMFPMLDLTLAVAPDQVTIYDHNGKDESGRDPAVWIPRTEIGAWIQKEVDALAKEPHADLG